MLLELHDLGLSLQRAGVPLALTDDRLVPYPKRLTFQADLDADGLVAAVRPLAPERVARLRKYECSKGGRRESTPGFNIEPLFRPKPGEDEKVFRGEVSAFQKALRTGALPTAARRRARLEWLLQRSQPNWQARTRAVNQCLQVAAQALLRQLQGPVGPAGVELEPLRELLRRSMRVTAPRLHAQLAARAEQSIVEVQPDGLAAWLLPLLFGKPAALVLELAEAAAHGPANHESVWSALNRCLLAADAGAVARGSPRGIFGEPLPADPAKMPERRLPRLGNVKLRSLSEKAACQGRYGLVESAACPVGKAERDALAAALEWITQPGREYVTWADVSDSCGLDRPALLLAYPDTLPALPERLSAFLAQPGREEGVVAEKLYEECARAVTGRLRVLARQDPRTRVCVAVLAKADAGRTRVLCSQQFTAARVLRAADEWQAAARHLPPILIRQFTATRGQACWREPLVPFPAEVVWCLNTAWQRGATQARRVPDLDPGAGLTLLLDTGPGARALASRALRLALANGTPLVLALAQAYQHKRVHPIGDCHARQALLLPGILGLLLAKIGFHPGDYMRKNPYWLGRLLGLADRLHRNYCDRERGGRMPPQLLGNALMPTALDNPVAGLARLAERLPLYYRCADAALRAELAEAEQALDRENLPERCGDADKAQMLLGYLARPDLLTSRNGEPPHGEER
jgi:hypothetical protein